MVMSPDQLLSTGSRAVRLVCDMLRVELVTDPATKRTNRLALDIPDEADVLVGALTFLVMAYAELFMRVADEEQLQAQLDAWTLMTLSTFPELADKLKKQRPDET